MVSSVSKNQSVAKPFLTAEWRNLLFMNYKIDASILTPYLPAGTEVDTWNGQCYVSLVGFMFLNTRVGGIAFPFHTNFEEFNLRFYVRFKDQDEWNRGVVFVKEIVPRRMITTVARWLYGERYYCYPMRHSIHLNAANIDVSYSFKYLNHWNFISAVADKESHPLIAGSEEEFITEHYWGYTRHSAAETSEYKVAHPKWRIHTVTKHQVHCNIAALYGEVFVPYFINTPASVFLAQGSAVSVYGKKRWKF